MPDNKNKNNWANNHKFHLERMVQSNISICLEKQTKESKVFNKMGYEDSHKEAVKFALDKLSFLSDYGKFINSTDLDTFFDWCIDEDGFPTPIIATTRDYLYEDDIIFVPITPENLPILKECFETLQKENDEDAILHTRELFTCRIGKTYLKEKYAPKELKHLFPKKP